jgi:UDP-2,3-diacylglucosamine hydrolase
MRDAYYFISDVHLGLESKEKEKLKVKVLLQFLDDIKLDAKELFIVGDLFDYWIEYKYVVPKGHYKVLNKISELIDSGIKITYLAGNHDFWRGDYFEEEFGIEISDKPIEKTIEGKKLYIHHGDGLAYNDTGYKILKKILRNKGSQFFYSLIHPDIGIWLAKKTSHTSRGYTSEKDYGEKDGLRDFAMEKCDEGYDYVIMGHRHFPVRMESKKNHEKIYFNLGDWMYHFTYAVFKNGKMNLMRYYDLKTNEFINETL